MFKKIVAALDLTERHQPALKIAAELAGSKGEVALVHVIEVIPGLGVTEEPEFYQRLERAARKHLKRHGDALSALGVAVREEVLYGSRALEIARYAEKVGAHLIVLTAPRLQPDRPAGWGSLSFKVGILASCPVLLVK